MKKLILASNNAKKLIELRDIFSRGGVEVITMREAGCGFAVPETGNTFEENAYLKAAAVYNATGLPAVADDSGLEVYALMGAPGVLSARYGGSHEDSDEYRNSLLLKNMEGQKNRRARFVCCICCVLPHCGIIRARGECEGEILYAPRGDGGFGYDPVFGVSKTGRSMAELLPSEKNAVSHRGRALATFLDEWRKYYVNL